MLCTYAYLHNYQVIVLLSPKNLASIPVHPVCFMVAVK